MPINNNPFEPWNGFHKDNPFAAHNGFDKDNPFKPWNNPFGNSNQLTDDERRSYGLPPVKNRRTYGEDDQ